MRDGNWPTALHNKASARMARFIGPRLEAEIKPAIAAVAAREHKWGLYFGLALAAGIIVIIIGYNIWKPVGHLTLILAAIVNFKVFSILSEKNAALNEAKAVLEGQISHELFQLEIRDIEPSSEDDRLSVFDAAGFFDLYDQIHHQQSYGPWDAYDPYVPHMQHSRMTRTEVETYTDSEGKRRTRERIVEVFNGVILDMEIPGKVDDSRILITSRRTGRPRGVFERTNFVSGRKRDIHMKKLKPASPRFNRLYSVEGDDPMETHEFLDPDRVMRFLNLTDDLCAMFKREHVGLSLLMTNGRAYFAIETGPFANVSEFTGSAAQMETQIETVAAQITLPHIIAEHLKFTPPPRYEWDNDIIDTSEESLV